MAAAQDSQPASGSAASAAILARMDGLSAAQLRMEALLTKVQEDLGAVAAHLGASGAEGGKDPPPASALALPDAQKVEEHERAMSPAHESAVSPTWSSVGTNDRSLTAERLEDDADVVPPSLPSCWPASVVARRGLSKRAERRHNTGGFSSRVRKENTSTTTEGLLHELAGEVRKGAGMSRHVMIDPNSNRHMAYSLVTLLVVLDDVVLIPYMLAWEVQVDGVLLVISWLSCIFWTLDILMVCITGYQQDGHLELRMGVVVRRYAKSWLLPDVAIVVSDWLSVISASTAEQNHSAPGIRLLRFAKAGKILRLLGLFRMMKAFKIIEELIDNSLSETGQMILRCFMIVGAMLWANHLFGCAWYFLGRTAPCQTGMRWIDAPIGWSGTDVAFLELSRVNQYITAFHWSAAQLTLGSMDVVAHSLTERIYTIFCLSVGLIFGSTLVSILSAGMVDQQMRRNEQNQQLRLLRRFLRENSINRGIATLVQQQVRERLFAQAKLQLQDIGAVHLLSRNLRMSLCYEIFKLHFRRFPLFRIWSEMDFGMVRELCLSAVRSEAFRSSDDVFLPGTSTGKAYCLVSGQMSYSQEPSTAPVQAKSSQPVRAGDWMCEAALWSHWIHVGTASTRSLCQVASICGAAMAEVARKHPQIHELCVEYCAAYHQRIVSALPPDGPFPTDLQVPRTDFTQILTSLSADVRAKVSLSVLAGLAARKHASIPGFARLERLREEVRKGECDLMVGSEGQLERLVSVEAMQMESSEGKVFVELGTLRDGSDEVEANCQLPGVKQAAGEQSGSSVSRLLAKFSLDRSDVDFASTEWTSEKRNSKELGVLTHYFRAVYHLRLRRGLDMAGPALPCQLARSTGECQEVGRTVSFHSSHLQTLVHKVKRDGEWTLYAWLEPDQFQHYSTHAGEGELASALANLRDSDCTSIDVSDAHPVGVSPVEPAKLSI